MSDLTRILRIDASARKTGSVTRDLADKAIDRIASLGAVTVKSRDVSAGLPFVTEDWVGANFTPAENRTNDQRAQLALSDSLVQEVKDADLLVIGLPIYNFGVPATMKAWVDQVARAGLTFRYTENGPVGLLEGKRAIVLVASGGTPVGSDIDFATPYIRHALGFIGIHDVTIIAADGLGKDAETKLAAATNNIQALAA